MLQVKDAPHAPTACRQVHQRTIGARRRIPIYDGTKSVRNDILSTPGRGAGLSNAPSWAERLPECAELLAEEDGELDRRRFVLPAPLWAPELPYFLDRSLSVREEASMLERAYKGRSGETTRGSDASSLVAFSPMGPEVQVSDAVVPFSYCCRLDLLV